MNQEITFVATRQNSEWIGEVIDILSGKSLARTMLRYGSEEMAKSAAVSLWRALQSRGEVT